MRLTRRRAISAGLAVSMLAGRVRAQGWPLEVNTGLETLRASGRYLPLLKAVEAATDTPGGSLSQLRAWWGDEAGALRGAWQNDQRKPELTGATAEDAIRAIVAAARSRRVVMLNEAHTASRHRAFLLQVARALRGQGFTHLAAETFSNYPPGMAPKRPFAAAGAITANDGYYLMDPVFAEAAREAMALGYRLVAYEQRQDQWGDGDPSPDEQIARREAAQAANLAEALSRSPEGRFLVHVGYGHLSKVRDRRGGPLMGARFMALTGIEPLTVTQSGTGSFGPHAPDNPIARAVLAQFRPERAIAVRRADGRALGGEPVAADLAVFHPSLPDVDGRPGWLAADPARRKLLVRIPASHASGGLRLAQAVHAHDDDPAVPADQYRLPVDARTAVFFLRPGVYRIRLETEAGFTPIGEMRA